MGGLDQMPRSLLRASLFLQATTKNCGHPGLVDPFLRDSDHGVVKLVAVEDTWIDAVDFKKDQRGAHRRPFVSIDERLILGDVKSVRRRDVSQVALP
ncbi:MAG TPA: hypothetical protein VGM73_10445 [Candidatus Didemnitutus sp.]